MATDTWISMGQEDETAQRVKDYEGYQVCKTLVECCWPDHLVGKTSAGRFTPTTTKNSPNPNPNPECYPRFLVILLARKYFRRA